jgi:hypothetical protein
MKTNYYYYYNNTPITKRQFLDGVPENWEKKVINGYYTYGYYHAQRIDDLEYLERMI